MAINFSKNKSGTGFLRQNRRELAISFSAILAILVSLIFPVKASGESFWLYLFLFLVFPFIVIRYLLKESFSDFGISWGKPRTGLAFSAAVTAVFVIINYLVISRPELRNHLTIPAGIAVNFWYFLFFELVIMLSIHFFAEFFFRGFFQLGLEKRLGAYPLILQAALQTLLILRGPWVLILLVFLSSLAAGLIARQSRSIYYSFVSMWIISVSLDIMIISIIRSKIY